MNYILTKETIEKATIPTLKAKYELALLGSKFIVEDTNTNVSVINSYYKQLYLMKVMAVDYMHLMDSTTDNELLSENEFNDLSLSNIFGQVKKFTYEADTSAKANVILRDYRVFKDMLAEEIDNELSCHNDILSRLDKELKVAITPETLEKIEKTKQAILDKVDKEESN